MIACASARFLRLSGPYPTSDACTSGGMPHSPTGFGSMAPPMIANPSISVVLNTWRSSASDIALRISGLSNGGLTRLTMRLICVPVVIGSQIAFGACPFISLSRRTLMVGGKGDIEFTGLEGEHARRQAVDDSESDFIQIWAVFFPVVGIADETDRLSPLELDEFERPGTDRPGAHRCLRHVAGIDSRKSACEQHRQARLRLAQL